jgi:hypothetical protein
VFEIYDSEDAAINSFGQAGAASGNA